MSDHNLFDAKFINVNEICGFQGEYRFLSNFYDDIHPIKLTPDDLNLPFDPDAKILSFPTAEHAFQAFKCKYLKDVVLISRSKTAGQAKRIGKYVPLKDNWEDIKLECMETVIELKFEQEELKSKLKDTYPLPLYECNDWKDFFWGCDYNKVGENHLGKILEKVRMRLVREAD